MNAKRDRIEIIHDILDIISGKGNKIKPTQIMYKANLSHQMLTDYLSELVEKDFISVEEDKKGKKTYSLTDKGFSFMKDYKQIRGFLESYGLFDK